MILYTYDVQNIWMETEHEKRDCNEITCSCRYNISGGKCGTKRGKDIYHCRDFVFNISLMMTTMSNSPACTFIIIIMTSRIYAVKKHLEETKLSIFKFS